MTTTAKKKPTVIPKAKQKKPSHAPFAFVRETPCEVCGSEWFSPGMKVLPNGEMEEVTLCANLWHNIIAQLKHERLLLAKLAATTPQFDNPLVAVEAMTIRDRVLASGIKTGGA